MARDRRPVQGQPVPAQATPPSTDRESLAPDLQVAALAAAIASLTQHISAQSGAISANTAALVNATRQGRGQGRGDSPQPRPTVGKNADPLGAVAGALTGGLTSIAMQLVAPLAPLAALAQTLSATTSGFGTFLKMTGLITTSLAGLFLPAMLVASGVVFALAKEIQGPLMEALKDGGKEIKALMKIAAGLFESYTDLKKTADALGVSLSDLKGGAAGADEALKLFGTSLRDVMHVFTMPPVSGVLGTLGIGTPWDPNKPKAATTPPGSAPATSAATTPPGTPREGHFGGGDFGEPEGFLRPPDSPPDKPADPVAGFIANMRKGIDLAMQSMRRDVGGPASTGQDLSNVWRAATMAGLGVDPIQAEMQKTMLDQLAVMEKMLAEMEKREAQYK